MVAFGMVVFALASHQALPWLAAGAGGLLIATVALGYSLARTGRPAELLGLAGFSRRTAWFAVAGCVVGAALGALHRWRLGLTLLPTGTPEMFAALACLIGATEELIYRGWLQGRLHGFGWWTAIVIAACSHAAYKTALFVWPSTPGNVDLVALAAWTVAGGILFGLLRAFSRSLIPPLLAHAVFDLVTYGAVGRAPWWVWS
jgi:membrane protease YdiL (CAAX protease family)